MVAAAVDYAVQNGVLLYENPDRPSLMPAEVEEGKGACNSTKVKVEPKLCEVPMPPICSNPAMQELAPTGDYPKN